MYWACFGCNSDDGDNDGLFVLLSFLKWWSLVLPMFWKFPWLAVFVTACFYWEEYLAVCLTGFILLVWPFHGRLQAQLLSISICPGFCLDLLPQGSESIQPITGRGGGKVGESQGVSTHQWACNPHLGGLWYSDITTNFAWSRLSFLCIAT